MPSAPGDRIGSHEIVALLGAGGMGEVYRARDATLGRGGYNSVAELAAVPGAQIIPSGDQMFDSAPGVYTFSKITVTRNLYRIPLQ